MDEHRKYEHPLFPYRQDLYESDRSFRKRAESWIGTPITIKLPVRVDGESGGRTSRIYVFSFELTDLDIRNDSTPE